MKLQDAKELYRMSGIQRQIALNYYSEEQLKDHIVETKQRNGRVQFRTP